MHTTQSRRGFTRQPKSQRAHFRAPSLQNTTKIPREDRKRGKKERKLWREREGRNFGPPTLRAPLDGPHLAEPPFGAPQFEDLTFCVRGPTLRRPTLRDPTVRAPPFGAHVSGFGHPTFKTETWCWPHLVLAKLSLAKVGVGHGWYGQTSQKQLGQRFFWPKMVTPMESRAKVEPGSGKHRTKMTTASWQKTCFSEGSGSRNNHRYAVVVQDLATQWSQSYPCKTKNFSGDPEEPNEVPEPKVIYTDNSLECGKSCEEFSLNHCTSTPHRSETNGIPERAVRRIKDWTSAVLLQSGLDNEWWADCGIFRIFYLTGRHHMKGGSECPSTEQKYRLTASIGGRSCRSWHPSHAGSSDGSKSAPPCPTRTIA